MLAVQHLYTSAGQKLHFTNHGINFFFYVISGQKFRTDLIKLFKRQNKGSNLNTKSPPFSNDIDSRQVTKESGYAATRR